MSVVFVDAHLSRRRAPRHSCFCPLGRTSEPPGLLKMLVCMDSIVSLLIAIVPLLVVPTPALVVVVPIVRSALRCFLPCFRIASLSLSVAVISEPARFELA